MPSNEPAISSLTEPGFHIWFKCSNSAIIFNPLEIDVTKHVRDGLLDALALPPHAPFSYLEAPSIEIESVHKDLIVFVFAKRKPNE